MRLTGTAGNLISRVLVDIFVDSYSSRSRSHEYKNEPFRVLPWSLPPPSVPFRAFSVVSPSVVWGAFPLCAKSSQLTKAILRIRVRPYESIFKAIEDL